ncbi:E3 ubiquitin-protein ligase SIAH1A-like [Megalops cyprinoides]|uniref:E3 ubiquitin-protein ligase SIAH1A-like n=1 Tax=Megalops cyprinoides TaxID=118141 RepID=UPI0018641AE3|nr:E3 ubiquitin-protein ligase SIAH1A-like [Megalops cyprinoides]
MSRQTAVVLPSRCTPSQQVPLLSITTISDRYLVSLFECPVCFDYALPPILQCQSGHMLCSNCWPKLTFCPTCRGHLGYIRNLAMERVANLLLFPCKYAWSGCKDTLSHMEKAEHEELCEFRPYSCPCPGPSCKWQGFLDAVIPHLMQQHYVSRVVQSQKVTLHAENINRPDGVTWLIMQSCYGFHFIAVLLKGELYESQPEFFAIVQLIGTAKQAEKFAYCIELNSHSHRLTWESPTSSIYEDVVNLADDTNCLMFDMCTAQMFAKNGNLDVNITIYMC